MAIFNVSNKTQLASALSKAGGGDTIILSGGNYGALQLSKMSFDKPLTIMSASKNNPAVLNDLNINNASNIRLEKIKFDYGSSSSNEKAFRVTVSTKITFDDVSFEGIVKSGIGTGHGLIVNRSKDIVVENSSFRDFQGGAHFSRIDNLKVQDNSFQNISHDSLGFAGLNGAVISGNDFRALNSNPERKHKDVIQFHTSKGEGISKDVLIKGNRMENPDGMTHGIFMGNPEARGGDRSMFYQNIVIEDNFIRTSQVHGVSVEHGIGVVIRNNTLIRNTDEGATGSGNFPRINVSTASDKVLITGNTVASVPNPAGPSWTVTNNDITSSLNLKHWEGSYSGKIVYSSSGPSLTSTASSLSTTSTTTTKASISEATTSVDTSPKTVVSSTLDEADMFRFAGSAVKGNKSDTIQNLDFAKGDVIVLTGYNVGTFRDVSGGNILQNNKDGSYVRIDSALDLQELVQSSQAVTSNVQSKSDLLLLKIEQQGGTHDLALFGMGTAFLDANRPDLF